MHRHFHDNLPSNSFPPLIRPLLPRLQVVNMHNGTTSMCLPLLPWLLSLAWLELDTKTTGLDSGKVHSLGFNKFFLNSTSDLCCHGYNKPHFLAKYELFEELCLDRRYLVEYMLFYFTATAGQTTRSSAFTRNVISSGKRNWRLAMKRSTQNYRCHCVIFPKL